MITTEWPSPDNPNSVPFLQREVALLRENQIDVKVFHFTGKRNPLNYLKAWLEVRRLVRENRFDLIHAQWGQSSLAAMFSRLPLVVTFRGSDLQGITNANGSYALAGKLLTTASRIMAKRAKRVIVVSEGLKKLLPEEIETTLIPSGLNFELFQPLDKGACRDRLGLSRSRKWVLFGGHPSRADKRFFFAKQAIEVLKKTMDAEIFYPDQVPQSEMPYYINAADLVLLTSKHEGSPNVVKEALACNIPVVSVDVGDVAERIGDIPGCALANSDQPVDIAKCMQAVLEYDLGNFQSRSHVLHLDENKTIKRLMEVYKSAIQ